ncbi:WD40 repeat domain-containing protein [Actinoplanes sp. NBC_00393]|uniref:WD40 repeat domain-containing protein n=1 Tax=Actinoplanes sp. NBC_00393 TaxID=2975953 RepID=UPI002E1C2FE8
MRIVWTTDQGPDPALRQVFRAAQPSAVAAAVVDGREVVVTLVDEHEDFDCELGELHFERCPEPGLRVWDRATGTLIRTVSGVCDNGTGYPALLAVVEMDGHPLAVVGDWARPPKLVDLAAGRRIGSLAGHDDTVQVQGIAVDGTVVVTAGWDGVLRSTDLSTGRTQAIHTGERMNAVAVVRIDGRPVAVAGRDTLSLWDVADGSRLGVLEPAGDSAITALATWPAAGPAAHAGPPAAGLPAAAGPGGPRAAVGSDGPRAATSARSLSPETGSGGLVAARDTGGGIVVWDIATGRQRRLGIGPLRLPGDIAAVTGLGGERLVAVDDGEAIAVWDVDAGTPLRAPLTGPVSQARLTAAGPGTLLAGSATDDMVSVWHLGADSAGDDRVPVFELEADSAADDIVSERQLEAAPSGGATDIRCLAVTPDGWVVAGGSDGVLRRWRAADGQPDPVAAGKLPGRVNVVRAVENSGRVQLVAAGGDLHGVQDGLLHRWVDGRAAPPVEVDHRGEVKIIVPYGPLLLTGGTDGLIHVIDLRTGQRQATIDSTYPPRGLAAGRLNGRTVVAITGMFEPFTLWDLESGTAMASPALGVQVGEAAQAWITTAAGPSMVTVHEARVRVHHLLTGTTTDQQADIAEPVTALAATESAKVAIARTDCSVSVIDVRSGKEDGRLTLPYPAAALAWAPAGRLIIACRRDLWCAELPAI